MKTICFVQCSDLEIAKSQMFGVNYMPVWIYVLAAYLRDIPEVEISMFDNRVTDESQLPQADFYFFTGVNQDFEAIKNFLSRARKTYPQATFVIGGPICWSFNLAGKIEKLYDFDHIAIGDGESIVKNIADNLLKGEELPKVIDPKIKFEIGQSRPMDKALLSETLHKYYGGVVEVSRGCPFLCEFCDIRIQLDNNRAHNMPVDIILEELSFFAEKGVNQVLFACDNFIGDPTWAEEVCDKIIEWRERSGKSVGLYTWLTINVARYPRLLKKMRKAGFDMFFIGVESFGHNQLLETAKVQNVKGALSLTESIQMIQSYGFIIVAGLIFGFDSDPDDIDQTTLDGIKECGLISGDPSLLTALPGTPLFKRMKLSGRLRDGKLGLGGHKYCTNIDYLRPQHEIVKTFTQFVHNYNLGKYQYSRLENFYKNLEGDNFISADKEEYISVSKLAGIVFKQPMALLQFIKRFLILFSSPERSRYIFKALLLTRKSSTREKNLWIYFKFWLFVWSNSIVKYGNISAKDFDIGYVGDDFDINKILPDGYMGDFTEPIPDGKIKSQRNSTSKALSKLIEEKRNNKISS